jgi:hypothetical protein
MIEGYPEAISELDSYQYWWLTQGNPTLSANATRMVEFIRTKK